MWYICVNGDLTKPTKVDSESSKVYVYIRKDFELVEATSSIPAHWRWKEVKIPKDAMIIYTEHTEALENVYSALMELADIIATQDNALVELADE